MSRRVNQLWPDGLYERVAQRAGRRGVTDFTTAAVEAALGGQQKGGNAREGQEPDVLNREPPISSPPKPEYVPGPEDSYRCPRDCNPGWRPTSANVRCPTCSKQVVPA